MPNCIRLLVRISLGILLAFALFHIFLSLLSGAAQLQRIFLMAFGSNEGMPLVFISCWHLAIDRIAINGDEVEENDWTKRSATRATTDYRLLQIVNAISIILMCFTTRMTRIHLRWDEIPYSNRNKFHSMLPPTPLKSTNTIFNWWHSNVKRKHTKRIAHWCGQWKLSSDRMIEGKQTKYME